MRILKKILISFFIIMLVNCGNNNVWTINGKIYKFENINANVYVIHGPLSEPNEINEGFMNNPAIIVGKKSLVVIDPGGSYIVGKKLIKEIEKISKLPIKAVFNTHIHGDHWLGNQAIIEKYPNVKIYAHPKMIQQAKEGAGDNWVDLMNSLTKNKTKDTKAIYPNNEIINNDIINVDEMSFIVHKPTPKAHSDSDVIIEHKNSNTIFAGDNLFNNRLGQFDVTSSILENIKALKYLQNLNAKIYIPGHGKSGKVDKTIKLYLNYLTIVANEAKIAYNEGLESYEIKEKVINTLKDYQNWHLFDVNIGKHLAKAILEIEEQDF